MAQLSVRTRALLLWVNVQHVYGWLRNSRALYRDRRFAIYQADFAKTWNGYDRTADYMRVWDGPTPIGDSPLDVICFRFQHNGGVPHTGGPPDEYMGRSVSVGDVIVIGRKAWAVEPFGFKRVRGFKHAD